MLIEVLQAFTLMAVQLGLFAFVVVRLSREHGWGREAVEIDTTGRDAEEARIDVNEASWLSLSRLPGLGPKTAQKIVADRKKNGPFQRPEDLERVPGIGPKTVARCRPHLRFPCDTRPASQSDSRPTSDPQ